jgi:phosphonate transport system substrate-binding protein
VADLTLAVAPSSTPGDRQIALDKLCAALSPLVGKSVRGMLAPSYQALAAAFERDAVQYAWMSPTLAVLTDEQIRVRPILSAIRNETTSYCAAMFVDADSEYDVLLELEGKTVAWVDASSAAGYLCPRLQLASRGIDPATFFGAELFLGSHAEVVRAVFDGRAQIGATYAERPRSLDDAVRRAGFLDVEPNRVARVLEWTPAIPNDVIAGHGLIPTADHRVFANAVLTLAERKDGRRLLYSAFHAENFMTAPRDVLAPLKELVSKARANGLLTQL